MAQTHRKLRRKDLKRPDEFMTFFSNVQDFFATRLRDILFAAAIVGVLGALTLGVFYYERYRDETVSNQFYTSFTALQEKQYAAAQKGFERLAQKEPDRTLGRLARLYLASTYLAQDNVPKARDALVAYLAEAHDPAFLGLALMEMGVIYERSGDLSKALGAYRQAQALKGPEAPAAELAAARILEEQGDKPGAIKAYQLFLEAHPFAAQRQDAVENLARLGVVAVPTGAQTAPPPR